MDRLRLQRAGFLPFKSGTMPFFRFAPMSGFMWSMSFTLKIVIGLLLGIFAGLFLGEYAAPFLIALIFFSPRAALCLAVGTLLATFCAVVIQLWYRSQANRSLFRRRQVSSKTATVSEAVVSILWAAGAALAFRHGIFMVPLAVMACIVMGVAYMLRPQAQN